MAKVFMAPNVWGQELSPMKNIVSRKWSTFPDWDLSSDFNEEPICGYCITEKWIYHTGFASIWSQIYRRFFGKLAQIWVKPISIGSESLCDHFWIFDPFWPIVDYPPSWWTCRASRWSEVTRNQGVNWGHSTSSTWSQVTRWVHVTHFGSKWSKFRSVA